MSPYQDQAIKDVAAALNIGEEVLRESLREADKMWPGSTNWNLRYVVDLRSRVLELEAAAFQHDIDMKEAQGCIEEQDLRLMCRDSEPRVITAADVQKAWQQKYPNGPHHPDDLLERSASYFDSHRVKGARILYNRDRKKVGSLSSTELAWNMAGIDIRLEIPKGDD